MKSGEPPSKSRATAMATADAPSAAMAILGSKRRTSSSRTKIAPAIGELNAVARPAPAPAASKTRHSGQPDETSCQPVRDARAHLHTRAFTTERQPRADGEKPAEELDDDQTKRRLRKLSFQHGLDVRDATAGRLRRKLSYQPRRMAAASAQPPMM